MPVLPHCAPCAAGCAQNWERGKRSLQYRTLHAVAEHAVIDALSLWKEQIRSPTAERECASPEEPIASWTAHTSPCLAAPISYTHVGVGRGVPAARHAGRSTVPCIHLPPLAGGALPPGLRRPNGTHSLSGSSRSKKATIVPSSSNTRRYVLEDSITTTSRLVLGIPPQSHLVTGIPPRIHLQMGKPGLDFNHRERRKKS